METEDQREVRLLLRDNRVKRQQLTKIRESMKADFDQLLVERTKLMKKAEKVGLKVQQKAVSS